MGTPLLAAYGTLMRAFGRHEALGVADALTFVASCRFEGRLYDLGAYPGAVPGDGTVRGEVFRLDGPDVWARLDRYEGYDPDHEAASLFVRRRASLGVPDVTAWVYWYNGDPAGGVRVPSGDWRAYIEPS